jgi:predicted CoA-binding protein
MAGTIARRYRCVMARVIEDEEGIAEIVRQSKRIAVLGIKTEKQSGQPAFYVPQYMQKAGVEIVPVPVYYPDVTAILGRPVYRRLIDVPGHLDLVNVFRRSQDVAAHLQDILEKQPKAVWMQLGIRDDEVAKQLVAAGIDVVMDRCLMVDHRRYA